MTTQDGQRENEFGQRAIAKVLLAIAAPTVQDCLILQQRVMDLLSEIQTQLSQNKRDSDIRYNDLQFTVLEQPGWEQLEQALEQDDYQVFHYISFKPRGNESVSSQDFAQDGNLFDSESHELTELLLDYNIKLVVLHCCSDRQTVTTAETENFEQYTLGSSLVKRRIPSVLVIPEQTSEQVAFKLMQLFYLNMAKDYPVDYSLGRSRLALISSGLDPLDCDLPILYQDVEFNGYLTPSMRERQHTEGIAQGLDNPTNLTIDNGQNLDNEFLDDDQNHEEDTAFVADLFRQIYNNSTEETGVIQEEQNNQVLPNFSNKPTLPQTNHLNLPIKAEKNAVKSHDDLKTKHHKKTKFALLFGGILLFAGLSTWAFQNRILSLKYYAANLIRKNSPSWQSNKLPQSETRAKLNQAIPATVTTLSTNQAMSYAIAQFKQGHITTGQLAVQSLLDRGSLPQAKAALATVPNQQKDRPVISFLYGRLAWQSVKTGDNNYSLEDAQHYWEKAVKASPKTILYQNALGFAYYIKGDLNKANQAWFNALYQTKNPKASQIEGDSNNQDVLTAYAGLALGLKQSAKNQPGEKKLSLMSKAEKLHQKVIQEDPVRFKPETLQTNWLWTKQTIQDWRSLQPIKQ